MLKGRGREMGSYFYHHLNRKITEYNILSGILIFKGRGPGVGLVNLTIMYYHASLFKS
jgi:hypothetical protein